MAIWKRGSAILRAPEGDNDGGGAGGGSGGEGGKGDPPKAITEEDVGRMVNAAFTSHLKRLNLEGKITEAIGGLKIDEKLTALTESFKASIQGPKPEPAPKGGGGGDQRPTVDPEITRQIQKLNDDLEKERTARLAAVQESENTKRVHAFGAARQKLYETLKPHASESLHDVWVDHLIHHQRLKVEDGSALLEVEWQPVKGMPKQKEFLPLDEAVPHLIAAEEAKRFLPVPDAGDGRGSPGPRTRRGSGSSIDSKNPMDRVQARLESMGINFDNEFS